MEAKLIIPHLDVDHEYRIFIPMAAFHQTTEVFWLTKDLLEQTVPRPAGYATSRIELGGQFIVLYDPTRASDQIQDLLNIFGQEGVRVEYAQHLENFEPPRTF